MKLGKDVSNGCMCHDEQNYFIDLPAHKEKCATLNNHKNVCVFWLQVVQRRVDLMEQEGVTFKTGIAVGDTLPAKQLVGENDAVVLTMGSTWPRDLPIPGEYTA